VTTEAQQTLNDNTFKALGHFVVEFSGLLNALEYATLLLIGPGVSAVGNLLLKAALADRTAFPIMSSFFSVFFQRWTGQLTDDDTKIMKCLRKEITHLIEKRNRLMHDVWMYKAVGGDPGPHDMVRHRIRAHGGGVEFETESLGPPDLEALASDAKRLTEVVAGAVWYLRPGQIGPELGPRMAIVDGHVSRI
jgi:hypothetical protein